MVKQHLKRRKKATDTNISNIQPLTRYLHYRRERGRIYLDPHDSSDNTFEDGGSGIIQPDKCLYITPVVERVLSPSTAVVTLHLVSPY